MKSIICKNCSASSLLFKNGFWICDYCGSKYIASKEELSAYSISLQAKTSSNIDLQDDIENLLQKCKSDSKNARKYANLILDLDPDNEEVLKYF